MRLNDYCTMYSIYGRLTAYIPYHGSYLFSDLQVQSKHCERWEVPTVWNEMSYN